MIYKFTFEIEANQAAPDELYEAINNALETIDLPGDRQLYEVVTNLRWQTVYTGK